MADIAQKSNIESNGAFTATLSVAWRVLKDIDTVLISEGAANANLRKVENLNAKSDEELAMMGLDREDIVRFVFSETPDT